MITAFEALLLPACMAVCLGLALGFGLESLIQLLGSLFPRSPVGRVEERAAVVKAVAGRSHARGIVKPAGCGRTSV